MSYSFQSRLMAMSLEHASQQFTQNNGILEIFFEHEICTEIRQAFYRLSLNHNCRKIPKLADINSSQLIKTKTNNIRFQCLSDNIGLGSLPFTPMHSSFSLDSKGQVLCIFFFCDNCDPVHIFYLAVVWINFNYLILSIRLLVSKIISCISFTTATYGSQITLHKWEWWRKRSK